MPPGKRAEQANQVANHRESNTRTRNTSHIRARREPLPVASKRWCCSHVRSNISTKTSIESNTGAGAGANGDAHGGGTADAVGGAGSAGGVGGAVGGAGGAGGAGTAGTAVAAGAAAAAVAVVVVGAKSR